MGEIVKFIDKGQEINLELTDEFQASLQILNETNESLFITGKAGCGKSTLLRYFVENTDKNVVVLAFTGLAAINVEGETIHSFFKLPIGFVDTTKIYRNKLLQQKLENVDVIVIDEISMVRADIIDAIDKSLRVNLDSIEPFGGKQMVFIGDLYQLPPIVGNDEKEIYDMHYESPFFFSAEVFSEYRMPYVNLEKIHRQNDDKFIAVLNCIRERNKYLKAAIKELNKRVRPDIKDVVIGDTISLTTTNAKSKEFNENFLEKLPSKKFRYKAHVEGDYSKKEYPTDEILELKVGAKVMFIKNDTEGKTYVNGDVGIVDSLDNNNIFVKKGDFLIRVKRSDWEKYKYEYIKPQDGEKKGKFNKKTVGKFNQFPLKLAWSVTIHKSQGQTYDKVLIDFHNGTFTSGQSYVALSRCRSLEGVTLRRRMRESDVILDKRIHRFYDLFDNIME